MPKNCANITALESWEDYIGGYIMGDESTYAFDLFVLNTINEMNEQNQEDNNNDDEE